MGKYLGDPTPQQTAKMNRERLAVAERESIMDEVAKKTVAVRENMARLRELRLAREAETVRTDVAAASQPAKARPKRRLT